MSIPRHDATGGGRRRRRGAGFTPLNLFAASEVGLWYDPSDLTPEKLAWVAANPGFTSAQFLAAFPTHTLYQNAAGTTPVTALGQPVGLVIDKSKGGLAALGPELVTNGDFSNGTTGWSLGANWNVTNGALKHTSGSVEFTQQTRATLPLGANKLFVASITVSGITTGNFSWYLGGANSGVVNSNGVFTRYFVDSGTGYSLLFDPSSTFDGTIDNVSIREVPGVHARQTTDAARPTLQARANLLTYSEQFDNAAWGKTFASVTSTSIQDPLGTNTAEEVTFSAGTATYSIRQSVAAADSQVYTLSAYVKAGTLNVFNMFLVASTALRATFNLTTQTISSVGSSITSTSIQSVGNSWYRCSITGTYAYPGANGPGIGQSSATDGTVCVWGAQLERGSSATTYQRVTTATDYADVGLPRALTFDGTDDSLVTPSVNFTATDKMTVCAGVFKQSDAAAAYVAELSIANESNNGTFALLAPGSANPNYRWRSSGTIVANITQATYTAPTTNILTGTNDIGNDLLILRIDGTQVATATTDQGTGNYGTYPLFIGRRNQTSNPFKGRIHQLIVRGAATDTATIQQTERFVAQKTGIAI